MAVFVAAADLGSIYQNLIKMMFLDILHLKMEILQCLVG
jgi:hypothetical protein